MFQLYKKRKFSEFLNDTFLFFKTHGKHFFKLYFTINGALLLVAVTLIYFIFKVYFDFFFNQLSGGIVQNNQISDFMENNTSSLITGAVFGMILIVLITIIQFAFPVIYLNLLDHKKGENFTTKDILLEFKKNGFKLFKFIIGFIFILIPILFIAMFINILLVTIIIGFFLFLITIPLITSFINLTFYNYIATENRFFNSISNAISSIRKNFWNIILCTLIIIIIIQVIGAIFSLIPYFLTVFSVYSDPNFHNNREDTFSLLSIIMAITVVISFIASFVLNNLLLINQGVIYYSFLEEKESVSAKNSIDLIGTDSE